MAGQFKLERALELLKLNCSTETIQAETGLSVATITELREQLNESNKQLLNE